MAGTRDVLRDYKGRSLWPARAGLRAHLTFKVIILGSVVKEGKKKLSGGGALMDKLFFFFFLLIYIFLSRKSNFLEYRSVDI